MPHINQLKESRFLKKEDCGPGILVTIKDCVQENVGMEDQPEELKWVLQFQENPKMLTLNATNAQIIASVCGSEITENWIGHKIVLFDDPNVMFKGKRTGGVRARAPKGQAASIQPKPVSRGQAPQDSQAFPDDGEMKPDVDF